MEEPLMRRFKFLLTAALLMLCALWTFATIEVQTTTPLVNCDGHWQVGQLRMIFSEPEFSLPGCAPDNTDFYVMVRINLTGVDIWSIANVTNPALWTPVELVVEADTGAAGLPFGLFGGINPGASFLWKWNRRYIDVLFTKNMYLWTLTDSRRVRVTIGVGGNHLPSDQMRSNWIWWPPTKQSDTRLCFDFDPTPDCEEFLGDFYHVGMVVYDLNIYNGGPCPIGHEDFQQPAYFNYYGSNFQPANPAIAQQGPLVQECEISAYWPPKGDYCNPDPCDQHPPYGDTCLEEIPQEDPCASPPVYGPIFFNYGECNIFAITEWCEPGSQQQWVFQFDGQIVITLNDPDCLDPIFCPTYGAAAWLYDYLGNMYALNVAHTSATSITIYLDDTLDPGVAAALSMMRTHALCLLVDLDVICYDICCVLDLPSDQTMDISVDIEYYDPHAFCSTSTIPMINDFVVAYVYGCAPPAEGFMYPITLWYPFLPPVNNPEVDWWGGIAITNYAMNPTEGGLLYLFEEDGAEWLVAIPPMQGHELYLRQIAELEGQATPLGSDTTFADKPMSGILITFVNDPPYTLWDMEPGNLYGMDSFVLMGDGVQAYGYKARAEDGFFVSPFGPIWSKK